MALEKRDFPRESCSVDTYVICALTNGQPGVGEVAIVTHVAGHLRPIMQLVLRVVPHLVVFQ